MIETKHPGRKSGIIISQNLYEELAGFIVHAISTNQTINLIRLMKCAEVQFPDKPDINQLIYHIKLDLEAKGMIKTVIDRDQATNIRLRLTSQGIRESRRNSAGISTAA